MENLSWPPPTIGSILGDILVLTIGNIPKYVFFGLRVGGPTAQFLWYKQAFFKPLKLAVV